MYMMAAPKKWTITTVRQHLPAVIRSAAREPQRVYRRAKLVAAVVGPELATRLKPKLAARLAELREICAEDRYELALPPRRDRPNSFGTGRKRLTR